MASRPQKCAACGLAKPSKDGHGNCVHCRSCGPHGLCSICSKWSDREWVLFHDSPLKRSVKKSNLRSQELTSAPPAVRGVDVDTNPITVTHSTEAENMPDGSGAAGVVQSATAEKAGRQTRTISGSRDLEDSAGTVAKGPGPRSALRSKVTESVPMIPIGDSPGPVTDLDPGQSATLTDTAVGMDLSPHTAQVQVSTGSQSGTSATRGQVNRTDQGRRAPGLSQGRSRATHGDTRDPTPRAPHGDSPPDPSNAVVSDDGSYGSDYRGAGKRKSRSRSRRHHKRSRRRDSSSSSPSSDSEDWGRHRRRRRHQSRQPETIPQQDLLRQLARLLADNATRGPPPVQQELVYPYSHPPAVEFASPPPHPVGWGGLRSSPQETRPSVPAVRERTSTERTFTSSSARSPLPTSPASVSRRESSSVPVREPDALSTYASEDPDICPDEAEGSEIHPPSVQGSASISEPPEREQVQDDEAVSLPESRAQSPPREYSLQDCIDWVYFQYPEQCTPPATPAQVKTLALTALKKVPTVSARHKSLPLSEAISTIYKEVDKEVFGGEPGKTALTAGKYPWIKPARRPKCYKTHSKPLADPIPPLDKDAQAVDKEAQNYKSVTIERATLHQLNNSFRQVTRIASSLDWFLGAATSELLAPNPDSSKVHRLIQAITTATVHLGENSVRGSRACELIERDGFLQRQSVRLSDDFKQEARMTPFSSQSLFSGALTGLAKKASEAKQRELLLFNKTKQQSASTAPARNRGAKKGKGQGPPAGGQGQSKFKKSGKAKGNKPFTKPKGKGSAPSGQHS